MELVNVLSQIPLPVIAVALLILAIITIVLAYQYAKMQGLDGIRQDVYQLILKAEPANEVKRASEPPKPVYNYGTWREDPFSVPEEELAMWAIISPNNMLIPPARERYMDLFTRVFGITRKQLTNGLLPDVKLEVQ